MMVSSTNDPRKGGTIYVLNLSESVPVLLPRVDAVFQQVGPEAAAELAAIMDGVAYSEILSRFESERQCYTARVEGKLAAYGWVSFDDEYIGELRLRLRLLNGEAYILDCATVP